MNKKDTVGKFITLILLGVVFFVFAFTLTSGVLFDTARIVYDKIASGVSLRLQHHILALQVPAKHYFLLPEDGYKIDLFTSALPLSALTVLLYNSLFNILFQPVFLCPFTPRVILNLLMLPFFIYGSVRYAAKVWILLLVMVALSMQIGTYDAIVESLVRHGMICELIYLLVGTAGFTGLTQRRSL